MLVLTRRQNESVIIPDHDITIRVVSIQGGKVRIAIDAPPHVTLLRGELVEHEAHYLQEAV